MQGSTALSWHDNRNTVCSPGGQGRVSLSPLSLSNASDFKSHISFSKGMFKTFTKRQLVESLPFLSIPADTFVNILMLVHAHCVFVTEMPQSWIHRDIQTTMFISLWSHCGPGYLKIFFNTYMLETCKGDSPFTFIFLTSYLLLNKYLANIFCAGCCAGDNRKNPKTFIPST